MSNAIILELTFNFEVSSVYLKIEKVFSGSCEDCLHFTNFPCKKYVSFREFEYMYKNKITEIDQYYF